MEQPTYYHSVMLEREKCKGCTTCLKHCPTEAIRVYGGSAHIIKERCIDCGACIQRCPYHAKVAVTDPLSKILDYKIKVALPAPTLYGQFKGLKDIGRLLDALIAIGFDDVYEVARGAEYVSREIAGRVAHRKVHNGMPLISSACPAIVRLIQVRFPELLDNVVDVISPMEAAALAARKRVCRNMSADPADVGIFFLTPCPAKMTEVRAPQAIKTSNVDGVISIMEVYGKLNAELKRARHFENLQHAGAYGVGWAQTGRDIPAYGTTHADYFYGPVPCCRSLTEQEVEEDYERNTGLVIVETFRQRELDPVHVPGAICRNHGPFTWGKDAAQAVYHAVVLEEVAKMAVYTTQIAPDAQPAPQYVLDKHFLRKHGPNAYYGQKKD